MKYKLIALDMDGTALTPEDKMSGETESAIRAAIKQNCEVVFCSGRTMNELRAYIDRFPGMHYAVSENGACVTEIRTGKEIFRETLNRSVTDRVMAAAANQDIFIQIASGGGYYTEMLRRERLEEFHMGLYYDLLKHTGTEVEDLHAFYRSHREPITKMNFYFRTGQDRTPILSAIGQCSDVVYVSGLEDNIELFSEAAGKGAALRALCAHLGVEKSEVFAIGDSQNDISMMQAAGLAVAMGNAIPAVKAMAHEVTEDNAHDGAAAAIRRHIL